MEDPKTSMEMLLDLELPLSVSFGRARVPLEELLRLGPGSVIELDRMAEDPVDVLVNERVVARGEVVVVNGNYGVRIQEVAAQTDPLGSQGPGGGPLEQ